MNAVLRLCICCVLMATPCSAQMMMGLDKTATVVAFSGAGDVVSSAVAWWGLRAYTAAYATGLGKLANICISTGNTGPDTTCGDVNSDSSGNFNIAGSAVSACSNSGANQCTVKTLYDQSGNTNCTTACDLTNATVGTRPILVVAGAANGCTTTSKPCMSFTGTQSLTTANAIGVFTQPNTISGVFNKNVSDGVNRSWQGDTGSSTVVGSGTAANTSGIYCGTPSSTVTASDSAFHAGNIIMNSSSSSIQIDSTNTTGLNCGTNRPSGSFLMGTDGFAEIFKGFITEMGFWNSAFNGTQLTNMNSNQHGYWGF